VIEVDRSLGTGALVSGLTVPHPPNSPAWQSSSPVPLPGRALVPPFVCLGEAARMSTPPGAAVSFEYNFLASQYLTFPPDLRSLSIPFFPNLLV